MGSGGVSLLGEAIGRKDACNSVAIGGLEAGVGDYGGQLQME